MLIISHRGYWKSVEEKNCLEAFKRSFSLGFGTETDVRDCSGEILISHDMPKGDEIKLEEFIELYCQYDKSLPLALNVKSDGLQKKVKAILEKYSVTEYFTFDMSIPDMLGYLNDHIKTFVRFSEYERQNPLWYEADGVWFDGFKKLLIDEGMISSLIASGKKVCIVSPELHKRNVQDEWCEIKKLPFDVLGSEKLILCTDIPEQALEYFLND